MNICHFWHRYILLFLFFINAYADLSCKLPLLRQKSQPTWNGCGTTATQKYVDSPLMEVLAPCCNAHDRSYGTCGASKDDADDLLLVNIV